MSLHRPRRPYSPAYAARQLEAAQATLASWEAVQPRDWRQRADKHQALQKWGLEVLKWERILSPPPIEEYRLGF